MITILLIYILFFIIGIMLVYIDLDNRFSGIGGLGLIILFCLLLWALMAVYYASPMMFLGMK